MRTVAIVESTGLSLPPRQFGILLAFDRQSLLILYSGVACVEQKHGSFFPLLLGRKAMASPSPTSEATAIPQTSPTFPHELTYNSAIKRKAYAAAAADARRKRRKALTRRKSGTMRKTTAAKPSSSDNEGKAPVAATSIAIVKVRIHHKNTLFVFF